MDNDPMSEVNMDDCDFKPFRLSIGYIRLIILMTLMLIFDLDIVKMYHHTKMKFLCQLVQKL